MVHVDLALNAFSGKHAGMTILVCGGIGARVMLAASAKRLVMRLEGEVETPLIIHVLHDARIAGYPASDDFSAMVDVTSFTGVLDWSVIPQISEVMPKGETTTNRIAYVVRDAVIAKLAKVNATLFPLTQHATFATESEARGWLGWD